MPYCPHCDMEFVEGVERCTDCGQPLVASKKVWLAGAAEREAAEEAKKARAMKDWMKENHVTEEDLRQAEADRKRAAETPQARPGSTLFVPKRQRAGEMKSSVYAFFAVGAFALAATVLSITNVIKLPMSGSSLLFFRLVMAAMGIACLLIGVKTQGDIKKTLEAAEAEEARTKEIEDWFIGKYRSYKIDKFLRSHDYNLDGEELSLQRYAVISELLVTGQDLPDPGYVDYLTERIYNRLYESKE